MRHTLALSTPRRVSCRSMRIERRVFVAASVAGVAAVARALAAREGDTLYGLIGRMKANPGQRDALIAVLVESVSSMPGCLSYIVAQDSADGDAIWIIEVWDSKASHDQSLSLPQVRDAIAKGRPMIAGMDPPIVTTPIGGWGLPQRRGERSPHRQ